MKKNIVILLLCITHSLYAQRQSAGPLAVGDRMPDIVLGKLLNSNDSLINYSSYRGKMVILDFWGTFCTPCVSSLKSLDSIQRSIGDKLVVLPLATEKPEVLKNFESKNNWFRFPDIVASQAVFNLFPHTIISHDIWIDPDGIIRAITGAEEINQANIEKIIADPTFSLNQKTDQMDFDIMKPFLVAGNGGNADNFISRTIFTEKIEGINGAIVPRKNADNSKIKSFVATNCSPVVLYYPVLSLARNTKGVDPADIFIESKGNYHRLDTTELINIDRQCKSYCYSCDLPEYMPDSLFFRKYYLDDLNRLLPWKGRIEKKRMPAYEIIRKSNNTDALLLAKSDSTPHFIFNDKERHILLGGRNVSFNNVIDYLRCFPGSLPIVNKSGYTYEKVNIDLGLKWGIDDAKDKPLDYETVRKSLNKYGLDIVKVPDGLVEVLVLSINN